MHYFLTGLILNMLLISFYVVVVFMEHPKCMSKSGKTNVTAQIDLIFYIGFGSVVIDFMHSFFGENYTRLRSYSERVKFG